MLVDFKHNPAGCLFKIVGKCLLLFIRLQFNFLRSYEYDDLNVVLHIQSVCSLEVSEGTYRTVNKHSNKGHEYKLYVCIVPFQSTTTPLIGNTKMPKWVF